MSLTPQELAEHDAAAERRVRDAEFVKRHPELAQPVRDISEFIAADLNIDPALRRIFGDRA